MARTHNSLDVVFWIIILLGIILLFGWLILKSVGVINSPLWVEPIPYIGGFLTALGFFYQLGKIKRGIEDTEYKVNRLCMIEQRFNNLSHEHEIAMGRIKLKDH